MKIYDNFNDHGLIPSAAADALASLGANMHGRQGRMMVAAKTQKAALEFIVATGFTVRMNLRVGSGNNLSAARDAGLLTEGHVVALPLNSRSGDPIVGYDLDVQRWVHVATLAGTGSTPVVQLTSPPTNTLT